MSNSEQPPRRRRRRSSAIENESSNQEKSTQPQRQEINQDKLTRTERQEIVDRLRQESTDNLIENESSNQEKSTQPQHQEINQDKLTRTERQEIVDRLRQESTDNFLERIIENGLNPKTDLAELSLSGFNLSGANLQGADLTKLRLSQENLSNANLEGANLQDAYMTNTDLSCANLQRANLTKAILFLSNLSNANLEEANLQGADLNRANLKKVKGDRANFQAAYSSYEGGNFSNASLKNANFAGAVLDRANFSDANLNNANFQEAQLRQVNFRNANLQQANLQQTDVTYADFSHANLKGANLEGATLSTTFLRGAIIDAQTKIDPTWRKIWAVINGVADDLDLQNVDLSRQDCQELNLAGANLQSATLYQTNFCNTDLSNANLSHADLREANLENASLKGANLTGVNLEGAKLIGTEIDEFTTIDPMLRQAWVSMNSRQSSNYVIAEVMPAILERYREEIQATIKPHLEINLVPDENLTWWQSKFAGSKKSKGEFPYLPKGYEYPKTPDGEYLHLLAQINFAETPHLEGFPKQGILQFYIADDDDYGVPRFNYSGSFADYQKDRLKQNRFRILYFPEPDLNENNLTTDFSFLPEKDSNFLEPYPDKCSAIQWIQGYAPIALEDENSNCLDGIFNQLNELEDIEESDLSEDFSTAYYDTFHNNEWYCVLQMGGYSDYFYGSDPRQEWETEDSFDILLLRVGGFVEGNSLFFYIQSSALARCDFSKVLYTMA
ncbi:MAG: pentapeptide repeat-containing protein [Cyanobacteriota bacterium]|nr:pentapeptide repeat-containing protein [Cyanobacteriota bacterium]